LLPDTLLQELPNAHEQRDLFEHKFREESEMAKSAFVA